MAIEYELEEYLDESPSGVLTENSQEINKHFLSPQTNTSTLDSVTQYLNEILKHPLLNKKEEVALGKLINEGVKAEKLLSQPGLDQESQTKMLQVINNGKQARQRLIESNLRLAFSFALRYQNKGLPLADLIQEANGGLMHAADKFDWRRGWRFSTYSVWWINQRLRRAIKQEPRSVSMPEHVFRDLSLVAQASNDFLQSNNREITFSEIAEITGIKPEKLEIIMRARRYPLFLGSLLSDDGEERADFIPDPAAHNELTSEAEDNERRALLEDYMKRELTDFEREVIERFFGLNGVEKSLSQIGQELSKSSEWIRQVREIALEKLRRSRKNSMLEDYCT